MLRAFAVFLLLAPLAALGWPLSEAEVDALAPGCLCSATDADFDGLRYPEQIPHCARNVSTQTKNAVKARFGVPRERWSRMQVDHRISLWAGGSNEVCNLVPIDVVKHDNKNAMEARLRARLQVGSVSHSEVIEAFQRWYQDCFFNDICE
jgi:hypothetical protein